MCRYRLRSWVVAIVCSRSIEMAYEEGGEGIIKAASLVVGTGALGADGVKGMRLEVLVGS